jgi:hypothetical protein
MGAWGVAAFEDDTALDWLSIQFEERGAKAVAEAINFVADFPSSEYLERDQGVEARIAAEMVAIAFGHPPSSVPTEVTEQINGKTDDIMAIPFIRLVALKAVDRLMQNNSEINDLWTEEDSNAAEWNVAMSDLTKRLGK